VKIEVANAEVARSRTRSLVNIVLCLFCPSFFPVPFFSFSFPFFFKRVRLEIARVKRASKMQVKVRGHNTGRTSSASPKR